MDDTIYLSTIDGQESSIDYLKSSNLIKHFHRAYEICYVVKGKIKININNQIYYAVAHDIIFINTLDIHYIEILEDAEYFDLIANEKSTDDFTKLLSSFTLLPILKDKEFNEELEYIFKNFINEKTNSPYVTKGYINIIFGKLIDHYEMDNKLTKNSNLQVNIIRFIDEHYKEDLNLETLANHFGYSKYYFSHIFKSTFNTSINNYVNSLRIRKIMKTCKNNEDIDMINIIFENGFASIATFYRVFRKIYNCSPKSLNIREIKD